MLVLHVTRHSTGVGHRPFDGLPLADPALRAALSIMAEYDCVQHRDARQHERDCAPDRRLQALGWSPYAYSAITVFRQPQLIIRDTDQALCRETVPERLER